MTAYCYLCGEPIEDEVAEDARIIRDPWGEPYCFAHESCLDNYDGPGDDYYESLPERLADQRERERQELRDAGRP